MKKLINLLAWAFLAVLCACQGNTEELQPLDNNPTAISTKDMAIDYYWYEGQKVNLLVDSTKLFIVYNSNEKITDKLSGGQLQISQTSSRSSKNTSTSWAIVSKNSFVKSRGITDAQGILYTSPLYTSQKTGKEIGISNLIHIKLKSKADQHLLDGLKEKYNINIYSQNKYLPLWFTVYCQDNTHGNVLELCRKIQDSGQFAYVEPDIMVDVKQGTTSFTSPNDPLYKKQWNLHGSNSINWENASIIANGDGIKIGLVDTGVEATHPDLNIKKVHAVYDGYDNSWYATGVYDSHGTACAGVIAAIPNNQKGIVGIAPNSTIDIYADPLIARPNASQNLASDLYIAFNTDDVVSCSWGGNDLNSSEIKDAIKNYAAWGRNSKGVVVVFSAGNDNGPVTFPANYIENILVVGATDKNGNRASFSNYGKELDVMAPGESIPSTGWHENSKNTYDYVDFRGTSASCPQVAAVAALVLSINPNLTSKEVCDIIERTARKIGNKSYSTNSNRPNGTWNEYYGYGLVDAEAAVKAAKLTLK